MMGVLSARVSAHHILAWYPWWPEENLSALQLQLQAAEGRHVGAAPPGRAVAVFCAESSLQPGQRYF